MNRLVDQFCRLIEILIAVGLAIMVVMVFSNVVLRYLFNSGIIISEELSRWLFLWVIFLGAAVAVKERSHLGTDSLISRLPVRGRRICLALSQVIMMYVTWLVFTGSLAQTRINWAVTAPVSGASMAFVYGTGVVFAVLTAIMLLCELWRTLSGKLSESELAMFKSMEESVEAATDERPDPPSTPRL